MHSYPGFHETFQTRTQTRTFKPGLKSQIAVFCDLKYQTSKKNFILRSSQAGVVQLVCDLKLRFDFDNDALDLKPEWCNRPFEMCGGCNNKSNIILNAGRPNVSFYQHEKL